MKISDIFSFVSESVGGKSLPYATSHSKNTTSYTIQLTNSVVVLQTRESVIDTIRCISVLFRNPDTGTNVTNKEQNGLPLLATIANIIGQLSYDVLFCVPEDDDIEVEYKKLNVYKVVLERLRSQNRILRYGDITVDGYVKPIVYAIPLTARHVIKIADDSVIQYLAANFGMEKFQ